jgi:molybdopterin-guanine dinucleotide biosynthesis protein MobB
MLIDLPILGICGWSGAGKTTLIESVLPSLRARGWKIAVVKRTSHKFDIDRRGKDSDRFFRAGADTIGHSPNESFVRLHEDAELRILEILINLTERYDLVLVEGYKHIPIPKVWLHRPGDREIPPGLIHLISNFDFTANRRELFMQWFDEWFPRQWIKPPVYGCLLIGGKSVRMGTPKHLLPFLGTTWLEREIDALKCVTSDMIIAGQGEIPEWSQGIVRLPDAPDAQGPMAGLLAAMRWRPRACWLAAACDLPLLSIDALSWLLAQRRPGCWAVLPRLQGRERVEPLLAYYDFRARNWIESLAAQNDYCLANLTRNPETESPSPPEECESAWTNINTIEEWDDLKQRFFS